MAPLKISARGRYSMQALFDLAHFSHGQPVPLHLIAQRQELSLPFLEQIFNRLKKSGIVASVSSASRRQANAEDSGTSSSGPQKGQRSRFTWLDARVAHRFRKPT